MRKYLLLLLAVMAIIACKKEPKKIHVTGISLDPASMSLGVGETGSVTVTVEPADAADKGVSWSTDNSSVATVSDGTVTAVSAGTATITATTADGGFTATCEVTVSVIPVTGISIAKSMSLLVGDTGVLTATVTPANATNKSTMWSSYNTSVVTVSGGEYKAVGEGSTVIAVYALGGVGVIKAECSVTVRIPSSAVAVDLGLDVKWAEYNLGATVPEGYGDYYAWGETETKSDYSWATYKFGHNMNGPFSDYNTKEKYGPVDSITVLKPSDDAAHCMLGGKWRIPTDKEWNDLRTECTWSWTTRNGINGMLVTGTNGKTIFLPAAGRREGSTLEDAGVKGRYWSSSLNEDFPCDAWSKWFDAEQNRRYGPYRYEGYSVRPVTD